MQQPPYDRPPLSTPGGDNPNNPNFGDIVNNSGQPGAQLPAELQGVNFGAFLLGLFWSLSHNYWLGLLCLVPCVNIVMPFYLLFKGNEAGWQSRRFDSIQQFKEVQHKWLMWGIGVTVVSCVLNIIFFVILSASGLLEPQAGGPSAF